MNRFKLFGVILAAIAMNVFSSGNPQKQVVAPGPFHRCLSSEFDNTDSIHYTQYKAKYCPAKGFRVRKGVADSCFVALRPIHAYGDDTIYLYYVPASDLGQPIPYNFGAIYKYKGGTVPVDSIEYFQDFP